MRIGICDKMQIAASDSQINIGDIADPQPVRTCGDEAPDQILVFMISVVRIGRMAWFGPWKREPEVVHDFQECIPARHPIGHKHTLEHKPQFEIADAWIHPADFYHSIYDAGDTSHIFLFSRFMLIVRLFGMVKQLAGILDCITEIPGQTLYLSFPEYGLHF